MRKPSRTTFRERLTDFVNVLRQDILSGQLANGQYLPSETTLAGMHQLSKSSVRKGLEILVEEGLIEKVPRIGNRISYEHNIDPVQLKFGYYPSLEKETLLLEFVRQFHQLYPHIEVQLIPLSYDEKHQSVKQLLQQDWLDVFTVNYSDFHAIAETGEIEIMLERQAPASHMYPYLLEACTVEGELYAQPFIFSPVMLCYNKNHFADAGVLEPDSSWDWTKLIDAAAQLTDYSKERYGFCFHALSENRWPIFLLQSGIKLPPDEQTISSGDKQKIIESLTIYRDIIFNQDVFPFYLSESDADVENLFMQEKVSMIITSYFSLNYLRQASFAYDISPMPSIKNPNTLMLMIGLSINKRSKNKRAASQFIEFMLSAQVQQQIRQKSLSIPSIRTYAEATVDDQIYRPPRFSMYREIVPTYRLFTDIGLGSEEMVEFRNALRLYLSKMEEESFSEKIDTIFNKIKNQPI